MFLFTHIFLEETALAPCIASKYPYAAMYHCRTVDHEIWRPGFWARVPWTAIASIFSFLVCCAALVGILLNSDGKETVGWPHPSRTIPVSVLLSLVVSIANLSLAVALSKGYEISWWTQALQGAQLRKLQFDLDIQRGISAVFGGNLALDKFAVAAVISLVVSIIDGPLIQRASIITAREYGPSIFDTNIKISNASLPANFSAFSGGGSDPQVLTPLFRNVSRAYSNREDLVLSVEGCKTNTTCKLVIPAPGFDISCTQRLVPYDLWNIASAGFNDQTRPYSNSTFFNQVTTFDVTIQFGKSQDDASYSTINVTALYKPDEAREGNMVERQCLLRLATVHYFVTMSDGIVKIEDWKEQNDTVALTTFSKYKEGELSVGSSAAGGFQSMIGGIIFVADGLYSSRIALRVAGKANGLLFNITGQAASNYLTSDMSTYSNYTMTWADPTNDIVNTVRQLMFRSVVANSMANSTGVTPQLVTVSQSRISNAYRSNLTYLAITLACMVLQALVVAYLLFGWHHLGRDMSLDPFELARALGAPLLQGGSSNMNIKEALSPINHHRIRYGKISNGERAPIIEQEITSMPTDVVVEDIKLKDDKKLESHEAGSPKLGLYWQEHVVAL